MTPDTSIIGAKLHMMGLRTYADYLDSDHWQHIRDAYAASDRPQDCACGSAADHLHHLTYERLGMEKLSDLEAICGDCHARVHNKRRRRRRNRPKPGTSNRPVRAYGRVIASPVTVRYIEPDPRPRER